MPCNVRDIFVDIDRSEYIQNPAQGCVRVFVTLRATNRRRNKVRATQIKASDFYIDFKRVVHFAPNAMNQKGVCHCSHFKSSILQNC